MVETFVLKGTIISVNPKLLCFDVKLDKEKRELMVQTATVYMVLCAEDTLRLPAVKSRVFLKSPHFKCDKFGKTFLVLTSLGDIVDANLTVAPIDHSFVDVVKKLNLTPRDVLSVAKAHKNLEKHFEDDIPEVITRVLQTLKHSNFDFQFLHLMKYVDDNSETYKDYSYWTFGTHWNWSGRPIEYLIGYFVMDSCNILYTDHKRQIPCVFTGSKEKIVDFVNSYVIISDYTYVTEIYNSEKFCTTECLVVDTNNVINLQIKRDTFFKMEPTLEQTHTKFTCEIVTKSQKIAVSPTDTRYWLQLKIDNINRLVRMKTMNEDVYPFVHPGDTFSVFYKNPPQKIWDSEAEKVRRIVNSLKSTMCYDLPTDSHFVRVSSGNEKVVDVSEALKRLHSGTNLVSFQGVITMKVFLNPMSSRTAPVTEDPRFGTPGVKTHKLLFESNDAKLEVILNNWENLAAPLGLIPNMRVIIRNVLPQKQKYYKSTGLTSIEAVSYEPQLRFETANLYVDVVRLCFLGAGNVIPTCTVVWGRVTSFSILGLKFEATNGMITLISVDAFGESKIIAKESAALVLLRLFLQLSQPCFQEWLEGFVALGSYNYFDKNGTRGQEEVVLDEYFRSVEQNRSELCLKCRKMDNASNGTPVFFMLDGR